MEVDETPCGQSVSTCYTKIMDHGYAKIMDSLNMSDVFLIHNINTWLRNILFSLVTLAAFERQCRWS